MTEYNTPKDTYDLVILPIGAGFKVHGDHLPMNTDQLLAETIAKEIDESLAFKETLILPTVTYGYYPAFDNVIDLEYYQFIYSLAKIIQQAKAYCNENGIVYVVNTGISTEKAIKQSISFKKQEVKFFHISRLDKELKQLYVYPKVEQTEGTHADEVETSLMLFLHPELVTMNMPIGFVNDDTIYGQPDLASVEKGKYWFGYLMNLIYTDIMSDIG